MLKKSTTDAIKTAEATDDLIGNKIADKIAELQKKKKLIMKYQKKDIYLKRQKIIDELRLT